MPIKAIREFVQMESFAGILLMIATVLAMTCINSGLADWYSLFLNIPVVAQIGEIKVSKPLLLWVNDGLMAIFFLLVALEIKMEMLEGRLADPKQWVFPLSAALGGMLFPALIFVKFLYHDPIAMEGWAIPAATDIAFALGILSLFGRRVPIGLKVFLMTFSILDDLAAIIIIAIFYTDKLSFLSMGLAAIGISVLIVFNRLKVSRASAYTFVGIILWVCVLKSGVHATLAGVIVAFALPHRVPCPLTQHQTIPKPDKMLVKETIKAFHPWVAYFIVPLFAFMNAGVPLDFSDPAQYLTPLPLGIAFGLFFGKPIGVFLCTFVACRLGWAKPPQNVCWSQILGVGFLGGIGFTMSLFITSLAFQDAPIAYTHLARFGILTGSLLSILVGMLVLTLVLPKNPSEMTRRMKTSHS